MKQSDEIQTISAIYCRVERTYEVQMEEQIGDESLVALIMDFYSDIIEKYDSMVAALEWNEYR